METLDLPVDRPAREPIPGPALDNTELENLVTRDNTIFDRLVANEADVVGLLAYSLSMQNKRDWLAAFQAEKGRDPDAAEMAAYDIGERIERRLATYRKLAEHALSGNSFWASTAITPVSEFSGAAAPATSTPIDPPKAYKAPPPPKRRFGDVAGKLVIACGVFAILVVAAFAARQWIGV